MLGVSLRLSDQADIGTPLSKYIQSNYSQDEYQQVQRSITDIQNQRKNVVSSISRQDTNYEATIDLCKQYYATLCTLQLHFPFGIDALQNIGAPTVNTEHKVQPPKSDEKKKSSLFSKLTIGSDKSSSPSASTSPQPKSPGSGMYIQIRLCSICSSLATAFPQD
jgi:hypothetical protein